MITTAVVSDFHTRHLNVDFPLICTKSNLLQTEKLYSEDRDNTGSLNKVKVLK